MKILYVTHKPIYPKIDGGCVAMDNFLRMLIASKHNVKHLTISTDKHPFELKNYTEDLITIIEPEAVYVNTKITPIKAFLALFSRKSYNVSRFESPEMNNRINKLLHQQSFDCVILESLFTTVFLSEIKNSFGGKLYLRTHNVESLIWKNLAVNCKQFVRKWYLNKLARDLQRYERQLLNQVDGILSISKADTTLFQSWGIQTPLTTVSMGFILDDNCVNEYDGGNFFHLGALNWEPNREAVNRLMHLFPQIELAVPNAKLHIIGAGTEKLIVNDENIYVDGFVKDLSSYCRSIGILVTPITSGSGVRIKILEMMALGIPVITTTIGAQGIDYSSSQCLIIANTNQEIIAACKELSNSKKLRMTLGTKARAYISENHKFDTNCQQLNDFIEGH